MKKPSNTGRNRKPGTFTKGDPRINRNGRPRSFDSLRALAQEIANEQKNEGGETCAERILREWRDSKNWQSQKAFLEVAFGKVPDKLEIDGDTIIRIVWSESEKNRHNSAVDAQETGRDLPGPGAV